MKDISTMNFCKLLITVLESPRFDTRVEKLKVCETLMEAHNFETEGMWETDRRDYCITGQDLMMGGNRIIVNAYDSTVIWQVPSEIACECCGVVKNDWVKKRGFGTLNKVVFKGSFQSK